jgi:predicted transposase YbfD/YdcC
MKDVPGIEAFVTATLAEQPLQPSLLSRLHQHFEALPDPRVPRTRLHPLKDILVISAAAVLCLADGFEPIQRWAVSKGIPWLRENLGLTLPNGIPHHDTFRRLLSRFPSHFLTATLQTILQEMAPSKVEAVRHIALDGKANRGSFDAQEGTPSLHMLHAFATEQRLLLACQEVDSKSNEIPAAPELIRKLDIADAVVTADAMHCQRETAAVILAGKGDYVLSVKENQELLHQSVSHLFSRLLDNPDPTLLRQVPVQEHRYIEKNRARIEQRICRRVAVKDWLPKSDPLVKLWPGLTSVLCLERIRTWTHRGEKKESASRLYFISSRSDSAARHQDWIRGHWEVENGLHLVLDVAFREDSCRARKDFAPANLAVLRRLVVNLVRMTSATAITDRIIGRRQQAAWNEDYLLTVLKDQTI